MTTEFDQDGGGIGDIPRNIREYVRTKIDTKFIKYLESQITVLKGEKVKIENYNTNLDKNKIDLNNKITELKNSSLSINKLNIYNETKKLKYLEEAEMFILEIDKIEGKNKLMINFIDNKIIYLNEVIIYEQLRPYKNFAIGYKQLITEVTGKLNNVKESLEGLKEIKNKVQNNTDGLKLELQLFKKLDSFANINTVNNDPITYLNKFNEVINEIDNLNSYTTMDIVKKILSDISANIKELFKSKDNISKETTKIIDKLTKINSSTSKEKYTMEYESEYYSKYLKYKNKYLELKRLKEGY